MVRNIKLAIANNSIFVKLRASSFCGYVSSKLFYPDFLGSRASSDETFVSFNQVSMYYSFRDTIGGHRKIHHLDQIKDVRDHKKEDRMESFFLSETTKYLYLLFDTDNFIHNQGQHGTVIETPNGRCIIEAGGYIFNTEAHPIDPSALHCCYTVTDHSFDFSKLQRKKAIFRGETVKDRKNQLQNINTNSTKSTSTNLALEISPQPETINQNNIYSKLKDNNHAIKMINNIHEDFQVNASKVAELPLPSFINKITLTQGKISNSQEIERLRNEYKCTTNVTWNKSYKIFRCTTQPFLQKLSILGEFF